MSRRYLLPFETAKLTNLDLEAHPRPRDLKMMVRSSVHSGEILDSLKMTVSKPDSLETPEMGVPAILRHELCVGSRLDDLASVKDHCPVSQARCRETMSDYERRTPFRRSAQGVHHGSL